MLARAFGFRERARLTRPDGGLAHMEMEAGDGVIMLASPTPHYEEPGRRYRAEDLEDGSSSSAAATEIRRDGVTPADAPERRPAGKARGPRHMPGSSAEGP